MVGLRACQKAGDCDASREERMTEDGGTGPFFEGDGLDGALLSSVLEGETILTAEEVEDGRRNRAI